MTEAVFVARYSASWKTLEQALQEPARSFGEIEQQMSLYRMISGHLSYARAHYPGSTLCSYLSQLTSQAHAAIYAHTQKRSVWRFLSRTLPALVRRSGGYILTAGGIFLLGTLVAFVICYLRPEYSRAFLGYYIDPAEIAANDYSNAGWSGAIMSNYILTNNIRVSILAFGLGFTCGVGTIYVLWHNGVMLGALAGLYGAAGKSLLFWSLILPHGVWELTAIFLAGAAGLRLGMSLVRPGPFRRRDAVINAARGALPLIALVTILLIVAGFIEGFVTPADFHPVAKLVFAGFTGILLALYLISDLLWGTQPEYPVSLGQSGRFQKEM